MFDTPYHASIVARIDIIDKMDTFALIRFDTLLDFIKETTAPMGRYSDIATAIRRKASALDVVRPSPVLEKAESLAKMLEKANDQDPNWVQKNLERIRREEQKLLDVAAQIDR